jgi:hypothetical protein
MEKATNSTTGDQSYPQRTMGESTIRMVPGDDEIDWDAPPPYGLSFGDEEHNVSTAVVGSSPISHPMRYRRLP